MSKNGELIRNIAYTILFSVSLTVVCVSILLEPGILHDVLGVMSLVLVFVGAIWLYRFWRAYIKDEPLFQLPSREEYLLIGYDQIPWSNIDHISLRKSDIGNMYAAVYFKNDRPPKGFNIENIKDKENFINHLKENASKKGYTFKIENNK